MSVHVNGGLRGALRADARDEKAAEQLRDVVRGAVAAGRLMAGQNKQMDAMLNSLQISGSGKTVGLTFALPAEFLDVLNGIAAAKGLTHGFADHHQEVSARPASPAARSTSRGAGLTSGAALLRTAASRGL